MKSAIVGSLTALLAGAGLALAEPPAESLPAPRNYSAGGGNREVPADQATPGVAFLPGPGTSGSVDGDGAGPGLIPAVAIDGAPYRYWIQGDYLLWWLKQDRLPPLLTAGTLASGGVLGRPGTSVLVGDTSLDRSERSGGQLTVGGWITDYHGFGLEGSFFYLEGISRTFSASGTGAVGTAVTARPFFNVLTGQQDAFPVTIPAGTFSSESGTTTATSAGVHCDNGRFFGADLHFIGNICCDAESRLDFLIGYRYLSLNDHFAIEQDTLVTPTNIGSLFGVVPASSTIVDRFDTGNRFNGGQFGLRGEWRSDRWSVRATGKVSFGASDEGVSIFGQTASFANGRAPFLLPGGFLANTANSGAFHTEQFAIVPEVNATIGYQVCDWLKLTAGYNLLYWSSVARAGDQIPHAINTLNVSSISGVLNSSTTTTPLANIHCTDFWAHGLNAGIELRF